MFLVKTSSFYTVQRGKNIHLKPLASIFQDALVNSLRRLSTTKCLGEEEKAGKMVDYGVKEETSSKAMRAYLERSQAYNKFMAEEGKEFKTGKRHLANMMGKDPEHFTDDDVNAAIKYLFPSGLFVLKARPLMKPPEEVHPPKKEAQFDETGRPFHYLFYSGKPNLYEYLHKLVDTIKELQGFEDTMIRKQLKPDPQLALSNDGYQWLTQELFEQKFLEEITSHEYRQLIDTLDRLIGHPYSYRVKELFTEARMPQLISTQENIIPKPELQEDGRQFMTHKDARRKSARADVTVRSPGTGLFTINGFDLSYFEDLHVREQLMFPLHFTGKLQKVDVECSARGGGPSGQSGAIRYALSMALRSFVDTQMVEKMRLAGLLTKDRRRHERKKPGQEGARRKFTWKKR